MYAGYHISQFSKYLPMKNYFRQSIFIFSFILFSMTAYSQHRSVGPYNTGIGLRGGFLYGVSIKHFFNSHSAVEGIIGTRWQGYSITGLFEYQKETNLSEDLDWFFGFGMHAGTYEERYFLENAAKKGSTSTVFAIGIDGIIGIEYKVARVPITFGIDFKPFMDLVNSNQNFLDAALTIRYIFK